MFSSDPPANRRGSSLTSSFFTLHSYGLSLQISVESISWVSVSYRWLIRRPLAAALTKHTVPPQWIIEPRPECRLRAPHVEISTFVVMLNVQYVADASLSRDLVLTRSRDEAPSSEYRSALPLMSLLPLTFSFSMFPRPPIPLQILAARRTWVPIPHSHPQH